MPNSPFGFERPEDSPGFLLWQTTVTWQRLIKKVLEPFGISHPQFVIMAVLMWFEEHQMETTQVLIANWTKLDKMTVSQSLKKLATRGLILRAEHETDTRAKQVTLTNNGKDLIRQLVPMVEQIDAQFFGNVSKHEQESITKILGKLSYFKPPK